MSYRLILTCAVTLLSEDQANMSYRLILTCAVTLLSLRLTEPQEVCFTNAFQDASWIACISPIMTQVQDDFDIASICLSGEREALQCLLAKIDECYNFMELFLNSTGLTQEQAEIIDFRSLWQAEMINIICEMSGGQCDGLTACISAPTNYSANYLNFLESNAPFKHEVQAVVGLCGSTCLHSRKDTCSGTIKFFHAAAFLNFTKDFDSAKIERTRTFVDTNCMQAAEFELDCVMERLSSSQMETCYEAALNDPGLVYDPCRIYDSLKSCVDTKVKPECGAVSSDLLKEGMLVTLPEEAYQTCVPVQGSSSAGLKSSFVFLLSNVVALMLI